MHQASFQTFASGLSRRYNPRPQSREKPLTEVYRETETETPRPILVSRPRVSVRRGSRPKPASSAAIA